MAARVLKFGEAFARLLLARRVLSRAVPEPLISSLGGAHRAGRCAEAKLWALFGSSSASG
jgi:hypothetical protein